MDRIVTKVQKAFDNQRTEDLVMVTFEIDQGWRGIQAQTFLMRKIVWEEMGRVMGWKQSKEKSE